KDNRGDRIRWKANQSERYPPCVSLPIDRGADGGSLGETAGLGRAGRIRSGFSVALFFGGRPGKSIRSPARPCSKNRLSVKAGCTDIRGRRGARPALHLLGDGVCGGVLSHPAGKKARAGSVVALSGKVLGGEKSSEGTGALYPLGVGNPEKIGTGTIPGLAGSYTADASGGPDRSGSLRSRRAGI